MTDLLGKPVVLVLALAALSLLPFLFMTLTAFVKISTVLQIVKSAVGGQNVPSNTVVTALSLALTLVAMTPLGIEIKARVAPELLSGKTTEAIVLGATEAVREPLKHFLKKNASDLERRRFFELAERVNKDGARPAEDDFFVLAPAFVVTELTEAFAMGFLLFLPFLVIDLVVANVLLALGMQMLNPTQVSLPFKLLLFVGMNGWGLLAESLVLGYT